VGGISRQSCKGPSKWPRRTREPAKIFPRVSTKNAIIRPGRNPHILLHCCELVRAPRPSTLTPPASMLTAAAACCPPPPPKKPRTLPLDLQVPKSCLHLLPESSSHFLQGGTASRSSSQLSHGSKGDRSPSPTHGGAGAKERAIDPVMQRRYLCHAVANMGALEAAAVEFVRLGVQDSLSSLLDRSPPRHNI